MEFVQIIEYQTSKPDEMRALGEEFQARREARTVAPGPRSWSIKDRDRENTYMTIVRFPSYEAAMENSAAGGHRRAGRPRWPPCATARRPSATSTSLQRVVRLKPAHAGSPQMASSPPGDGCEGSQHRVGIGRRDPAGRWDRLAEEAVRTGRGQALRRPGHPGGQRPSSGSSAVAARLFGVPISIVQHGRQPTASGPSPTTASTWSSPAGRRGCDSLVDTPVRQRIDGHDVVAITYDFDSVLLTDPASPATSEPKLAKIGGIWSEPFNLPVDPELVMQRTGYACMDEADFPFNSVDSEEVDSFYDQDAVVEADAGQHRPVALHGRGHPGLRRCCTGPYRSHRHVGAVRAGQVGHGDGRQVPLRHGDRRRAPTSRSTRPSSRRVA